MTGTRAMKRRSRRPTSRVDRRAGPSLRNWEPGPATYAGEPLTPRSIVDCGWGRLVFAHTFPDAEQVAETLRREKPGQRDIAFYLRDPHVVLSLAPQELFLDPSHTFRLWLTDYRPAERGSPGFYVTVVRTEKEIAALNRIYAARHMVTVDPEFLMSHRRSKKIFYLIAKDDTTDAVLGVVMGVDHHEAFDDPEQGSSLWSLAVDPQAPHPGIGQALIRRLAERFKGRGRSFMDLSVMHDNAEAIALYEKLGFQRIPVFAIKTRNWINERLYTGPAPEETLNPYARIIVDEARRRGIAIEVLDADWGCFKLSFGGRSVTCRESLSELTSAIAMSRCADKVITRRVLHGVGLSLPVQADAGTPEENARFLGRFGSIVVKPACGEQGAGVSVDLRTPEAVNEAVEAAARTGDRVIIEQYVKGEDLRIIVINDEVVAAAVRRPAEIIGNGRHTIAQLIERQSRRRAAATGGESRIPVDGETKRCVEEAGHGFDDVLDAGETLAVRKTANLHTGGTIHDVTADLHPALAEAARAGARALEIPVVGFDFLVPSVGGSDYVIIEANERPGLANHEPQPTAERFVDLLFPQTVAPGGSPRPPSQGDRPNEVSAW